MHEATDPSRDGKAGVQPILTLLRWQDSCAQQVVPRRSLHCNHCAPLDRQHTHLAVCGLCLFMTVPSLSRALSKASSNGKGVAQKSLKMLPSDNCPKVHRDRLDSEQRFSHDSSGQTLLTLTPRSYLTGLISPITKPLTLMLSLTTEYMA